MNELELEVLKQNDMRVFKIFCEELIEDVLTRTKSEVVVKMKNKLMRNIFIDENMGNKIYQAENVVFKVIKNDDLIEYSFNIDEEDIIINIGRLEETLVLKTLLFKN